MTDQHKDSNSGESREIAKPLGYPPEQRGPKHSNEELGYQFIPLFLYSWPAVYAVIRDEGFSFQSLVSVIAIGSIFLAVILFPWIHAKSGKWEPTENPPTLKITEVEVSPDRDDEYLDSIESEYKEVLAEARYRDKLLLQTSYFSLGVIGLLGGIFINTPRSLQPFVLMVGSLVLLAFVIAVNSYKDSRDALWDRAGKIECLVPEYRGVMTSFNTVRQFDRRLFNCLSLSVYVFGLTTFMMLMTSIGYVYVLFEPI